MTPPPGPRAVGTASTGSPRCSPTTRSSHPALRRCGDARAPADHRARRGGGPLDPHRPLPGGRALLPAGRRPPGVAPGRAASSWPAATSSRRGRRPSWCSPTATTTRSSPIPIERDGDRFSTVVRPHDVRTVAGHVPLAEGPWDLYARIRASGPAVRVKLDRALLADLPTVRRAGRRDVMVRDVEFDSLAIVVPPELPISETKRAGQRRLQTEEYPGFLRLPRRDLVLFDSYALGAYGDDARALHEELARRDTGLDVLWSVVDGQAVLPEGVRAVPRFGHDWYEATGSGALRGRRGLPRHGGPRQGRPPAGAADLARQPGRGGRPGRRARRQPDGSWVGGPGPSRGRPVGRPAGQQPRVGQPPGARLRRPGPGAASWGCPATTSSRPTTPCGPASRPPSGSGSASPPVRSSCSSPRPTARTASTHRGSTSSTCRWSSTRCGPSCGTTRSCSCGRTPRSSTRCPRPTASGSSTWRAGRTRASCCWPPTCWSPTTRH